MLTRYVIGLFSISVSAFCLAGEFILTDYALNSGLNLFETLFFRGLIALIIAACFDFLGACYNVCCKNISDNNHPLTNRSRSLSHSETDPLIAPIGEYDNHTVSLLYVTVSYHIQKIQISLHNVFICFLLLSCCLCCLCCQQ